MVSEEHIHLRLGQYRQSDIVALTLRINDFLDRSVPGRRDTLVDFKLEFGRLWENEEMRIVLADEISPDNCRLWDSKTNEKMDKDRFRRDLGKVEKRIRRLPSGWVFFRKPGCADEGRSSMQ